MSRASWFLSIPLMGATVPRPSRCVFIHGACMLFGGAMRAPFLFYSRTRFVPTGAAFQTASHHDTTPSRTFSSHAASPVGTP